jgi:hypothetical protein
MVVHTVVGAYLMLNTPARTNRKDAWTYDRGLWCPCTCNEKLMYFDVHVQAMARVRAIHLWVSSLRQTRTHTNPRIGI